MGAFGNMGSAKAAGSSTRKDGPKAGRTVCLFNSATHKVNEQSVGERTLVGLTCLWQEETGKGVGGVVEAAQRVGDKVEVPLFNNKTSQGQERYYGELKRLVFSITGTSDASEMDLVDGIMPPEDHKGMEDLDRLNATWDKLMCMLQGLEDEAPAFDNVYAIEVVTKVSEVHKLLDKKGKKDDPKNWVYAAGSTEPLMSVYRNHYFNEAVPLDQVLRELTRPVSVDTPRQPLQ